MIQISRGQYDRVWGYIEAGKQEGARPVLGGVKRAGKGFFVDPTSRCSIKNTISDIHGRS
jgi:aldehyde dehydrogenase (NAD+)